MIKKKGKDMKVLKMKAWGDFDTPYHVNVAAGDDDKIQKACNVLSEFCKALPGCDQDVELKKYLEKREDRNRLQYLLTGDNLFSPMQAVVLVNEIQHLCDTNCAYIRGNMFMCEQMIQI
jgi:hypothetical protein